MSKANPQWAICIVLAIGLLLIDELIKLIFRRRSEHEAAPEPALSPAPVEA